MICLFSDIHLSTRFPNSEEEWALHVKTLVQPYNHTYQVNHTHGHPRISDRGVAFLQSPTPRGKGEPCVSAGSVSQKAVHLGTVLLCGTLRLLTGRPGIVLERHARKAAVMHRMWQ